MGVTNRIYEKERPKYVKLPRINILVINISVGLEGRVDNETFL